MIVISDMNIIKDLMDKNSQAMAGRPPMHAAKIVTGGMNMALAGYSKHR
jgi:hypothetical protein